MPIHGKTGYDVWKRADKANSFAAGTYTLSVPMWDLTETLTFFHSDLTADLRSLHDSESGLAN